jgi:hypothetical protein
MTTEYIIKNDTFFVISAEKLRETPSVLFNKVPVLPKIDSIDYVEHAKNAKSPAIKGKENETFWYMHTCQTDNLLVIHGTRFVQLYSSLHKKVENFEVTANYVKHNGKIIHEGMSIFGWPKFIYHRVDSANDGSKSINFAVHDGDFDIKTNFNIYSLNTETGESEIARHGFEDQPTNY